MSSKTDIAALVGSRICHDLISPIGAIGNGVELMLADLKVASPELSLISESIASATARIRFFRMAYGMAGPDHRVASAEVSGLLAALSRGGRLHIDWQSEKDLDRRAVRLALLLVQTAESAMPRGGRISVAQVPEGWLLLAESERLRIEPHYWALLTGENEADDENDGAAFDLPPAQVQFLLAAGALRQREAEAPGARPFTCTLTETSIRLEF